MAIIKKTFNNIVQNGISCIIQSYTVEATGGITILEHRKLNPGSIEVTLELEDCLAGVFTLSVDCREPIGDGLYKDPCGNVYEGSCGPCVSCDEDPLYDCGFQDIEWIWNPPCSYCDEQCPSCFSVDDCGNCVHNCLPGQLPNPNEPGCPCRDICDCNIQTCPPETLCEEQINEYIFGINGTECDTCYRGFDISGGQTMAFQINGINYEFNAALLCVDFEAYVQNIDPQVKVINCNEIRGLAFDLCMPSNYDFKNQTIFSGITSTWPNSPIVENIPTSIDIIEGCCEFTPTCLCTPCDGVIIEGECYEECDCENPQCEDNFGDSCQYHNVADACACVPCAGVEYNFNIQECCPSESPYYNEATGECVACQENSNCPECEECVNNECVPIVCPEGTTCIDGTCVNPCSNFECSECPEYCDCVNDICINAEPCDCEDLTCTDQGSACLNFDNNCFCIPCEELQDDIEIIRDPNQLNYGIEYLSYFNDEFIIQINTPNGFITTIDWEIDTSFSTFGWEPLTVNGGFSNIGTFTPPSYSNSGNGFVQQFRIRGTFTISGCELRINAVFNWDGVNSSSIEVTDSGFTGGCINFYIAQSSLGLNYLYNWSVENLDTSNAQIVWSSGNYVAVCEDGVCDRFEFLESLGLNTECLTQSQANLLVTAINEEFDPECQVNATRPLGGCCSCPTTCEEEASISGPLEIDILSNPHPTIPNAFYLTTEILFGIIYEFGCEPPINGDPIPPPNNGTHPQLGDCELNACGWLYNQNINVIDYSGVNILFEFIDQNTEDVLICFNSFLIGGFLNEECTLCSCANIENPCFGLHLNLNYSGTCLQECLTFTFNELGTIESVQIIQPEPENCAPNSLVGDNLILEIPICDIYKTPVEPPCDDIVNFDTFTICPYNYIVSNGEYTVIVTLENGCQITETILVEGLEHCSLNFESNNPCRGEDLILTWNNEDLEILSSVITVPGGQQENIVPSSTNSFTLESESPLYSPGEYTLTIYLTNGCSIEETINIELPPCDCNCDLNANININCEEGEKVINWELLNCENNEELIITLSNPHTPYLIPGCTDPSAINYDPNANINNNSCFYSISGCTDPNATNYNPNANINDGSCNYDPGEVEGCMDPNALNYNPNATIDNGSCVYPQIGDCQDDCNCIDKSSCWNDGISKKIIQALQAGSTELTLKVFVGNFNFNDGPGTQASTPIQFPNSNNPAQPNNYIDDVIFRDHVNTMLTWYSDYFLSLFGLNITFVDISGDGLLQTHLDQFNSLSTAPDLVIVDDHEHDGSNGVRGWAGIRYIQGIQYSHIAINTKYNWVNEFVEINDPSFNCSNPPNRTSLIKTIAHEMGHILGLGHAWTGSPSLQPFPCSQDQTMAGGQPHDVRWLCEWGPGIAGTEYISECICKIYGDIQGGFSYDEYTEIGNSGSITLTPSNPLFYVNELSIKFETEGCTYEEEIDTEICDCIDGQIQLNANPYCEESNLTLFWSLSGIENIENIIINKPLGDVIELNSTDTTYTLFPSYQIGVYTIIINLLNGCRLIGTINIIEQPCNCSLNANVSVICNQETGIVTFSVENIQNQIGPVFVDINGIESSNLVGTIDESLEGTEVEFIIRDSECSITIPYFINPCPSFLDPCENIEIKYDCIQGIYFQVTGNTDGFTVYYFETNDELVEGTILPIPSIQSFTIVPNNSNCEPYNRTVILTEDYCQANLDCTNGNFILSIT